MLSIQKISPTLPGVSTNEVHVTTIPDIIARIVDGCDCCDIDEQNIPAFIDVCGFLAIYPATFEVLEFMNEHYSSVQPLFFSSWRNGVEGKALLYN